MTKEKTQADKTQATKRLDDYGGFAVIYILIIVALIGGGVVYSWANRERHVVTHKADNMIEYKSLKDGTVRVLDFDNRGDEHGADTKRLQYYRYINPGDTIEGAELKSGGLMPSAWQWGNHSGWYPRVSDVNGNKLYKWIEMQRRDSVIRVMRRYEQKER